jgi:hypothetical protein
MNRRQYKKQQKKILQRRFTLPELLKKRKPELLVLAQSRNLKVFQSWNKTKISNAIITNQ